MVEEMRTYLSARIAEGWNSPDPARQEPWLPVYGGENQGGRARKSAVSAG